MTPEEIARAFDDVFDQALIYHAFAEHMRDYDLYIDATADPRTGIAPVHLRYRFTHCVKVAVATSVMPEVWARSLDERLIDYAAYAQADDLNGYVWGVNWQMLYPGLSLVDRSDEAAQWEDRLGIPFHEATVGANGHNLTLLFSDLVVTTVEPGTFAFEVPEDGPDGKIPLG